jgi:hypothetical protein
VSCCSRSRSARPHQRVHRHHALALRHHQHRADLGLRMRNSKPRWTVPRWPAPARPDRPALARACRQRRRADAVNLRTAAVRRAIWSAVRLQWVGGGSVAGAGRWQFASISLSQAARRRRVGKVVAFAARKTGARWLLMTRDRADADAFRRSCRSLLTLSITPTFPVFGWAFDRDPGVGRGHAALPVGAVLAMALRLAVGPVTAGVAAHSAHYAVKMAAPLAPALMRALAPSTAPACPAGAAAANDRTHSRGWTRRADDPETLHLGEAV